MYHHVVSRCPFECECRMREKFHYVLIALLAAGAFGAGERVVYEANSLYHHIIVSEDDHVRVLRFHKGAAAKALGSSFAQSVISLEDPHALYMNYAKYSIACTALVENPKRVLFIGLGAGSMPRFFARTFPGCRIDVAEIDAKVVEVARRFFFLPEIETMKITVIDGRIFLKQSSEQYDIIFLDAYRDQLIPFHLMTRDFLEELKSRLATGGVLVSNVAVRDSAQLYPWMLRTYQSSFGTLFCAKVAGSINKVLVAWPEPQSQTEEGLRSKVATLAAAVDLGYDAAACAADFEDISNDTETDRILTDDYAPVNLMWRREADSKDWEY